MKDLTDKLDKARASFLKCAGIAPQVSHLVTLAWDNGAENAVRLMSEWSKQERLRLERIHNYECRRHD